MRGRKDCLSFGFLPSSKKRFASYKFKFYFSIETLNMHLVKIKGYFSTSTRAEIGKWWHDECYGYILCVFWSNRVSYMEKPYSVQWVNTNLVKTMLASFRFTVVSLCSKWKFTFGRVSATRNYTQKLRNPVARENFCKF